jgi:hypothetical protein
MEFKNWLLFETTLNALYNSAIEAFPNTTKRQHVIHEINIDNINFIPFAGMKTLLVKATAKSKDKEYIPIILFKNINYYDSPTEGTVIIKKNNKNYYFKKPSIKENDVNIRCNCRDFEFRFNFYNHVDESLYGRKRAKYIGQGLFNINPQKMPGMCKHIMALIKNIEL